MNETNNLYELLEPAISTINSVLLWSGICLILLFIPIAAYKVYKKRDTEEIKKSVLSAIGVGAIMIICPFLVSFAFNFEPNFYGREPRTIPVGLICALLWLVLIRKSSEPNKENGI